MRRRSQHGAAAVEWAMLAPVFVLLICVMVAGWRLGTARSGAEAAAQAGARAASIERTAPRAAAAGATAVQANLAGVPCRGVGITIDTAAFATAPGTPAAVGARLHCQVPLADLLVPGLPGSVAVDVVASTPLDRYRGRK